MLIKHIEFVFELCVMKNNLNFLRLYFFFGALWPMSSVVILYFQNITGSYTSAMFVYSLVSFTQTLMELPSGIISDKLQRKHVLMLSAFMLFFCYTLWALAGSVHSVICLSVGSLLCGVSTALTSGTLEAFVFETVQGLNKSDRNFAKIYSQLNVYGQVGLGVASLMAALFLKYLSFEALAWFCLIPFIVVMVCTFCFKEPKRLYVKKSLSSLSSVLIALRRFKRNKKLSFFALIRVMETSVEVTIHRFEAAYFKTLVNTSTIALIRVLKQVFGALGFYLFSFFSKHNPIKIYTHCLALNTFFRALAVLLNNTLAPFFMAFINLFYGPITASGTTLMQQNFSAQQRATLQSVLSLISGFFVVIMMCVLGAVADLFSPQIAILAAVLFKVITVILPLLFQRKIL